MRDPDTITTAAKHNFGLLSTLNAGSPSRRESKLVHDLLTSFYDMVLVDIDSNLNARPGAAALNSEAFDQAGKLGADLSMS